MPGNSDLAKRYCNRANECMQVFATSQTPGTGEIYLLIAEHYLLLAASVHRGSWDMAGNSARADATPKGCAS